MKKVREADYLFLALIVIHLAVVALLNVWRPAFLNNMAGSILFTQMLIVVPTLIYFAIKKINPFKYISYRKIDISTILMGILFAFLIMPLVTFINAISMLFTDNAVQSLSNELINVPFVLNVLLVAVTPACFEEFVFRGAMYHNYKKKGVIYGAVLSGILFGLMHLNFNQFSYAFVLGIVFALLIEATGSIFSSMIAHFIINGNSVFLIKLYEIVFKKMYGDEGGAKLQEFLGQATAELDGAGLQITICVYGVIALFTTAAALGVLVWLAQHNNRIDNIPGLRKIVGGSIAKSDEIEVEEMQQEERIPAVRLPLVIAIALCLGYMLYIEFAV